MVKLQAAGCSGQRGLLSLFVRRTVLLGKGVGAAFTAVATFKVQFSRPTSFSSVLVVVYLPSVLVVGVGVFSSSVQFSSAVGFWLDILSYAFGLDFVGYYFLSSIITFKVQP